MPSEIAIIVEHLTKVYKLYSSPVDRLKESLHPLRRRYHHEFYALNDVNLTINKGESVGIVGKNGSGKSTLLKILTGVLTPSSGSVTVNGKISALLELGAGFNPELSGIENVYFSGMLMGYSRDEMSNKLDDILAFADIGEFVFQSVKTYSSGMFVRLAFAVAANVEPEIMIIDEALSVGDVFFQQKCVRKMHAFKDNGGSIVFVSHDMNSVKVLCHNALFLDSGTVRSYGLSSGIVDMYLGMILQESTNGIVKVNTKLDESGKVQTTLNAEGMLLLSARIYNEEGCETNTVTSEESVSVDFVIQSIKDYDEPSYGIIIRNRHGVSVFETNSYCMNANVKPLNANEIVTVRFVMNLNLRCGDYAISFGCANKGIGRDNFAEILMLEHDAIALTVIENKNSIKYDGITNLKPTITIF